MSSVSDSESQNVPVASLYDMAVRAVEALAAKEDLRAIRSRIQGAARLLQSRPYPLHRNEATAPFFVIGSGRCGTTLFRRLIQAQGNTYVPPENWALGRCIRQYHKYGWAMDWKDMVDLQVGTLSHRSWHWFDEPPRALVESLHDMPPDERSLAALLDAEYRYHADLHDRTPDRWGDKSPGNVFHAEAISEVFPRAKFIHLLRDGVDVVASWIKYAPYTDDLEGAAGKWRWSVRLARQFLETYPDKAIEVRYEDLVRDPEVTMRTICDFLDHPFTPHALNEDEPLETMDDVVGREQHADIVKTVTTDNIGKGRRRLENDHKRKLKDLIGETLDVVGYDPITV